MTRQVKEIAERLYGLRTAAGLSVERMAEVTNTGVESYIRAESGESDFSFSFLLRCAKEFGVPYHVNATFFSALASHARIIHGIARASAVETEVSHAAA